MAKDVIINGETYPGVVDVALPTSGGTALFRDVDEIAPGGGVDTAPWHTIRGSVTVAESQKSLVINMGSNLGTTGIVTVHGVLRGHESATETGKPVSFITTVQQMPPPFGTTRNGVINIVKSDGGYDYYSSGVTFTIADGVFSVRHGVAAVQPFTAGDVYDWFCVYYEE